MAAAPQTHRSMAVGRQHTVKCSALFKTKTVKTKVEVVEKKPQRNQSAVSRVVDALDFATPTKKDADLLWEAKDNWKKGESKLTPEQYSALARKIRGSYKDYFKDYVVEERVESTYYKPTDSSGTVPYLPLLVGVVLAMLATTAFVVSQTA